MPGWGWFLIAWFAVLVIVLIIAGGGPNDTP
jgi:hypothetical protein